MFASSHDDPLSHGRVCGFFNVIRHTVSHRDLPGRRGRRGTDKQAKIIHVDMVQHAEFNGIFASWIDKDAKHLAIHTCDICCRAPAARNQPCTAQPWRSMSRCFWSRPTFHQGGLQLANQCGPSAILYGCLNSTATYSLLFQI